MFEERAGYQLNARGPTVVVCAASCILTNFVPGLDTAFSWHLKATRYLLFRRSFRGHGKFHLDLHHALERVRKGNGAASSCGQDVFKKLNGALARNTI